MASQTQKIIDDLIESGLAQDVLLHIHTNGTMLSLKHLEKFKQFAEARIYLSVDGWDKANDYIRYPSKWSVIHRKLKMVYDFSQIYSNIRFEVISVAQIFNLFHLPTLISRLWDEFFLQKDNLCDELIAHAEAFAPGICHSMQKVSFTSDRIDGTT